MRYLIFVPVLILSSCGLVDKAGDRLFGGAGNGDGTATPVAPVDASLTDETETDGTETISNDEADDSAEATPAPAPSGPKPTVASLGDPAKPGMWLETPIVQVERQGRITVKATGRSAEVTLIPIEGEETAGSRLSVSGFQAVGASLTDLVELTVQPL